MEDTLKKAVNIGIGAIKSLQENYGDSFKNLRDKVETYVDEFEKKGAASDDSVSTKIREGIDEFMSFVGQYQSESHPEAEPAKPKKKPTTAAKKKKAAAEDK